MINRARMVVMLTACLFLLLPVATYANSSGSTRKWIDFAYVWLPLILMGLWFIYAWRKYAKVKKRSFEHMEKVEQLLERIANAEEKNDK